MIYTKTFEKYTHALNPRLKSKQKSYRYQIHVKFEHGDADIDTEETYNFEDEKEFKNIVKFYYEILNYTPSIGNTRRPMGWFNQIPAMFNSGGNEQEVEKRLVKIAEKYGISEDDIYEYCPGDQRYDYGYAKIEGIKGTIDGDPVVFVWGDSLSSNKIKLPKLGDTYKADTNLISGYGPSVFGGTYEDYLPNNNKGYTSQNFEGTVIDCAIQFSGGNDNNQYFHSYNYFDYVLLIEASPEVTGITTGATKFTMGMKGYDPDFETKFNKDQFDGLNFYYIDTLDFLTN
tara:strand:- start:63434 stop:64294 length:861 start_codon:yes stop_codon:yes gene_type:complete